MTTRLTRWLPILVGALAVALILAALIWAINRSASKSEDNGRSLQILRDCTIPGGKCYERGQQGQAEAIHQLAVYQLYTNDCTQGEWAGKTPPEQLGCVADLVKKYGLG